MEDLAKQVSTALYLCVVGGPNTIEKVIKVEEIWLTI
jgi:hypothetical protein